MTRDKEPIYPIELHDEDFDCVYCTHFVPVYGKSYDLEDVEYGYCHRHAPTVGLDNGNPVTLWPEVDSSHWCGDWEPRER